MPNLYDLIKNCNPNIRDTYESRKVAEDILDNNLRVSTVWTDDYGFETAIDNGEVLPVERYTSREDAVKGHKKWMDYAADPKNTTVTKLGYDGLVDDVIVTLRGKIDKI